MVVDCIFKVKLLTWKSLFKKVRPLSHSTRAFMSFLRLQLSNSHTLRPSTYQEYLLYSYLLTDMLRNPEAASLLEFINLDLSLVEG